MGVTTSDLRQAVRALLFDEDDRVLLVRFEFTPPDSLPVTVWALPGGGIDDGEHPVDGLRRELAEELGLHGAAIGPHVWTRVHMIPMLTGHAGQRDEIYLVRTTHFEPLPTIGWEALRAEFVHELRWWTLPELEETPSDHLHDDPPRRVVFAPRRLAALTRALLREGPPAVPIDTGV